MPTLSDKESTPSSEQLVAAAAAIPLPLDNGNDDDNDSLKGLAQLAAPPAIEVGDSNKDDHHDVVDVNAAASTADNDDDNDPLKGLAQLAGPPVVDVTGVTDVTATITTALPPSSSPSDLDLKVILQISSKIKDKASRERALLMALRNSRRELEDAESANNCATHRLTAAKEVYTICAQFLAGYTPLENRIIGKKKKKKASTITTTTTTTIGGTESNIAQIIVAKRIKLDPPSGLDLNVEPAVVDAVTQMQEAAIMEAEGVTNVTIVSIAPRSNKGSAIHAEGQNVILPTNEIYLPEYYTAGGTMDEPIVSQFRESFYLHLTKGQSDAQQIDSWQPPPNNANLKSRTQLQEWIHIATHWNTGADGLDAGAFRAKHKTWYSRMKPVTYNLGRRTGIHLREHGGMVVLCRYNKAGNKSIVYLDVGRLFDALFQIHALELTHRGRDATKNLADERYANIPDATVRAFLDTCPVCSARRGHGPLVDNAEQTLLQQSLG